MIWKKRIVNVFKNRLENENELKGWYEALKSQIKVPHLFASLSALSSMLTTEGYKVQGVPEVLVGQPQLVENNGCPVSPKVAAIETDIQKPVGFVVRFYCHRFNSVGELKEGGTSINK